MCYVHSGSARANGGEDTPPRALSLCARAYHYNIYIAIGRELRWLMARHLTTAHRPRFQAIHVHRPQSTIFEYDAVIDATKIIEDYRRFFASFWPGIFRISAKNLPLLSLRPSLTVGMTKIPKIPGLFHYFFCWNLRNLPTESTSEMLASFTGTMVKSESFIIVLVDVRCASVGRFFTCALSAATRRRSAQPQLAPTAARKAGARRRKASAQEPQTTHRSGTSNAGGSQQGGPVSDYKGQGARGSTCQGWLRRRTVLDRTRA